MTEMEWSEREKRLTRIRRVSAFMKWMVSGVLLLILIFGLIVIVGISLPNEMMIAPDETIDFADIERPLGEIPQIQRFGLSIVSGIAFVLLMLAGWNIRQVFKRFQSMEFFSPQTLASVISFGVWLIAFATFDLISDPVGSVLLTYDFPPGERSIDVTLDGGELFFFVLGALMLLFGWILREAALIADENRQFI